MTSIVELAGVHAGETVYVIAAGASASGRGFSEAERNAFRSATTIAVNHPLDWLDPTYLVRFDTISILRHDHPNRPVLELLLRALPRYRRERTTKVVLKETERHQFAGALDGYEPDYWFVNRGFRETFRNNDSLPVRNTTTTGALWLAVHMGALRIIVIGLDLDYEEDPRGSRSSNLPRYKWRVPHHFDDVLDDPPPQGRFNRDAINTQCTRILNEARAIRPNVEIINGNLGSLCTAFPKIDIHELLVAEDFADRVIEEAAI